MYVRFSTVGTVWLLESHFTVAKYITEVTSLKSLSTCVYACLFLLVRWNGTWVSSIFKKTVFHDCRQSKGNLLSCVIWSLPYFTRLCSVLEERANPFTSLSPQKLVISNTRSIVATSIMSDWFLYTLLSVNVKFLSLHICIILWLWEDILSSFPLKGKLPNILKQVYRFFVLFCCLSLQTFVRGKSSMPTTIWWLPNRHEWLGKESWSRGTYSVFSPIYPPPLPMLSPSLNSHWTKRMRVA